MEKLLVSNLKLGIIAGGQLGKMLIQCASHWDIACSVLDQNADCPAGSIANSRVCGSPLDEEAVVGFGRPMDVLTLEVENVHVGALKKLRDQGVRVEPGPEVIERAQDKGAQKALFDRLGLATAPHQVYGSAGELFEAVQAGRQSLPFVQKLRRGGFDGRGVAVIRSLEGLADRLLEGPSIVEPLVEVAHEFSIIVARNRRGQVRTFPAVEMVFNPEVNLVEMLICPSRLDPVKMRQAGEMAAALAVELDMAGVLAVEFFIDRGGAVLVNEVAPRPHNSGHHTIESVMTSQFEQHLRGILNLPLGSTELKMPAVMINLLGQPGHSGPVRYEGLTESLALDGVKIHVYGKKETRPYRKMGHVTVLAPSLEEAIRRAAVVKELIRVKT